jgi:hypothetical protein
METVVAGHLFGHLHSEEFRVLQPYIKQTGMTVPLLIASSITPIYGSNPSYRQVHYNESTGDLLDYETFFLSLDQTYAADSDGSPIWNEVPSFTQDFEVNDLSVVSLQSIVGKLSEHTESADRFWNSFLRRQYVYSSSSSKATSCDRYCRAQWLCILKAISILQYTKCLQSTSSSRNGYALLTEPLFVTATIVVVAATTLALFAFARRYLKRRQFSQVVVEETHGPSSCEIETTGTLT